jgi:hypothetical protein
LKAHVGIEHEEFRPMGSEGEPQALEIMCAVEEQRCFDDELDIEGVEVDVASEGKAVYATLELVGSIFGGEEENRTGMWHGEAAQARPSGGDGHRHLQSQPCLAGLGSPSKNTHRTGTPERFDQPAMFILWLLADLGGTGDTEFCDAHR